MENSKNNNQANPQETEFKMFATKRIVVGILLTVVALWIVGSVIGFFEKPSAVKVARHPAADQTLIDRAHKDKVESSHQGIALKETHYKEGSVGHIMNTEFVAMGKETPVGEVIKFLKKEHRNIRQPFHLYVVDSHDTLLGMVSLKQLMFADAQNRLKDIMTTRVNAVKTDIDEKKAAKLIAQYNIISLPVVDRNNRLVGVVRADDVMDLAHAEPAAEAIHPSRASEEPMGETALHEMELSEVEQPRPKGVTFIEAMMKPMSYELHQRFWGWRPNDILNFTDNVNNFQLGVLEVTRRTSVILAERISRTGSTASFDKNLERAMNWFMIKADRYWFPSPESKYSDGLKELKLYKDRLEKGEANFYTRTDNLIPLLMAYEDLLGSCDENLVKDKEDDGTPVSFFMADDYFYYAKGVATAMQTILEAILNDFHEIVNSRRGLEVLHHAIESCHHAAEINPIIITNSSLSGILANHRANMAAPISHARFHVGVLIKTLST
jgi:CBS domain-containing protein